MNLKSRQISSFKNTCIALALLFPAAACSTKPKGNEPIDRYKLVSRHNVKVNSLDTMSSLSVGNGGFAFTVDATGLQTFPEYYSKGVCLGTQSDWGWHSFPNTQGFKREEYEKTFDVNGRKVPYAMQWREKGRNKDASDYFRINPHRLHLGVIGFELEDKNGKLVTPSEIKEIAQQLDLWKGEINSQFSIDGKKVTVTTVCHPNLDQVSCKIESELISNGQLKVKIRLPYPTGGHVDDGIDWGSAEKHTSTVIKDDADKKIIKHTIDTTTYFVEVSSDEAISLQKKEEHYYLLTPTDKKQSFSFSVVFSPKETMATEPFAQTETASTQMWEAFWKSGGAVDLSQSKNPQAPELERRIVLSQYLTRIQDAGIYPPQETGLTFNSWFGKFHLEMHWWHMAHYALWNRIDLLEKSMNWYAEVYDKAKAKAQKQGYAGVRWPKMTDVQGNDSPSNVGEFLIWQQPHLIYFAELCYRSHHDTATLNKYAKLVFETADFMASFATWDETRKCYMLNPPLIPAQECLDRITTVNPPFELSYWHWGLSVAQEWRKRLGMAPNPEWQKVIDGLPSLPSKNGLYLLAESVPDSYENLNHQYDHPMPLGAFGMLPAYGQLDTTMMKNTLAQIMKTWQWDKTWGWDYPMVAMNATRLGEPEKAIEGLLMNVQKNTYLPNGHNYQDDRLRIYLPGNGGTLAAVAMMCAGYEGCTTQNPGFPKDGSWVVKWENLNPLP